MQGAGCHVSGRAATADGLLMLKRPGDTNSIGASSLAGSLLDSGGSVLMTVSLVALADHVDVRYAGIQVFAADYFETEAFIKSRGLHLCTEHLAGQAIFLGFGNHAKQDGIAHMQAASILEYRNPTNMSVR